MHGGLSPELKSLEQIKRIARPTDVPDSGLLCDLLWADPDKDIQASRALWAVGVLGARVGGTRCAWQVQAVAVTRLPLAACASNMCGGRPCG